MGSIFTISPPPLPNLPQSPVAGDSHASHLEWLADRVGLYCIFTGCKLSHCCRAAPKLKSRMKWNILWNSEASRKMQTQQFCIPELSKSRTIFRKMYNQAYETKQRVHTDLPSHVAPFPSYPWWQVHMNEPSVFWQSALVSQVSFRSHSFMSVHIVPSFKKSVKPSPQLQLNAPSVFSQVASLEQLSVWSSHSFTSWIKKKGHFQLNVA